MIATSNQHRQEPELPTADIDLERSCLGLMLWKPEKIAECSLILKGPEDFAYPSHSIIYARMLELVRAGQEVNIHSFKSQADRNPAVLAALEACIDRAGYGIGPPPVYCAKVLAELARKRRAFDRLEIAKRQIEEGGESVEVLSGLRSDLEAITAGVGAEEVSNASTIALDAVGDWIDGGEDRGLRSGFADIDAVTGGMMPGQTILVAARTSIGKSALCLNIACHNAKEGLSVAYFSVEMPPRMLASRVASVVSGVPVSDFSIRRPTAEQAGRLARVPSQIAEWNLHLIDCAGWSVSQIEARAMTLAKHHGLDLVIVDYLQKINSGKRYSSRQDEVSHVSGVTHEMAMRLDIPVLAAAQINRQTESHADKRPQLHHLRESGSLEQDADVIMLLHREDWYHRKEIDYTPTNEAEIDIAKNRNGDLSAVSLFWHGPTMTFKSLQPTI